MPYFVGSKMIIRLKPYVLVPSSLRPRCCGGTSEGNTELVVTLNVVMGIFVLGNVMDIFLHMSIIPLYFGFFPSSFSWSDWVSSPGKCMRP